MSNEPLALGHVTYKKDQDGNTIFSEWEHLQDLITIQHNRLVNNYFKDVTDINFYNLTGRASLKYACWMKDNDTSTMVMLRFWLFYVVTGHLKSVTEPYWGIPIEEHAASRRYRPQIVLHFKEDANDVEPGFQPVRGRISFRLMSETSETITKTELINLGKDVKRIFGAANGYIWKKGKDMATYQNKLSGFDFQLLVRNKIEAKELISKTLQIVNRTPDWQYFEYKENEEPTEAFPTLPQKQTILGKQYYEPRRRPIAECRFQCAECRLWGIKKPFVIYDRSYTHPNALVTDQREAA